MRAKKPIPFCGGMKKSRSEQTSSQECINWYPQIEQIGDGTTRTVLIPTPGTDLWKDLPNAPAEVRGSIVFGGNVWVVSGANLYEVTPGLTTNHRGTLNTSTGQVSMIKSRTQIAMVDGSAGYVWDSSTGFAQITDPEFPNGARRLSYDSSYAIAESPDDEIMQISASGDFTSWDGLDFTSAESQPDNIVAHVFDHSELWVFGENSIEIFNRTTNADFPYERARDGIEFGIASAFAVAKLDNTLYWVGAEEGSSLAVWRANGYTPFKVSDHGIDKMLGELEQTDDIICYGYQQEGHPFFVITSPSGNWTIAYDVSTNLWHQRAYYNTTDGSLNRHRANCYVFFDNKHLVGDFELGRIYSLSLDKYDDYTGVVKRVRSGPPLGPGFFPRFGIEIEAGVADNFTLDPQYAMRYSDDDGKTWSDPENCEMGQVGEYMTRCEWWGTGSAEEGGSRVFEVSTTDAVKAVIRGAYL